MPTVVHRPHHLEPVKNTARVILAVKNFAAIRGVCHIGLGVTATNTMKVLRRSGYQVESWATQTVKDLRSQLAADIKRNPSIPISHIIVSAPSWVQPDDFKELCIQYPDIEFVLLNHSGCCFLSIDKFGIRNIRQCADLELSLHNFRVSSNNKRVVNWFQRGLNAKCLYLPNLYDTQSFIDPFPRNREHTGTLRIGSFGAGRPWKNQLAAAEAAVQMGRQLGVPMELYVNSKRPDGGERMIESRIELFDGLRDCKLIEVPWESWPRFRETCQHMHLLLQPSFDETFNVVTADGIAVGVPSVTSEAIEWTPKDWWCETCDPSSIVRVGMYLLHDKYAIEDGREHLKQYVATGVEIWKDYLGR
jgi:hypothetical protein